MSEDDKCTMGDHVVVLSPPDERGNTSVLRHKADHTQELGSIRIVRQGEDVRGKRLLVCRPMDEHPGRMSVQELHVDGVTPPPAKGSESTGPAMVSSDAFRDGWERIFGGRAETGKA